MKEFDPGDAPSIASMTDRVRQLALGMAVTSVHFLGDRAHFVGAEENVAVVGDDGAISQIPVHGGAILCTVSDGERIVMGGDNGKVIALDARGEVTLLATDPKRRWIDNVALHPDGAVAWSAGKTAFVRSGKGEEKSFDAPSTVGGLAFAPKGLRLAIAHYNGVTLWFPNMAAKPEFLEWAGSHLGVTFSPDNKFLVTAMHEPALHGWRLADNRHMRMSGYPGRVRSMSWSAGGKGLATSGADTVIIWPFASKDGPMSPEAGHHGGRLQQWHRADGAARRRRGNPPAPGCRRADLGAGMEQQGHAGGVRCGRRRGWIAGVLDHSVFERSG